MDDISYIKTSAELLAKKQGSTSAFILYPFLFLIFCISIFLFLGKKETYIETYGVLDIPNISTKVVSPSNTEIININIDNGSFIKKDDVLMEFDTTVLKTEIDSIKKNIEENEEKLVYLDNFLDSVNKSEDKLKDNKFGYQSKLKQFLSKIVSYSLEDSMKYDEINHSKIKVSNIDNSISEKNIRMNDHKKYIKYIDGELFHYSSSDPKLKESLENFEEAIKNINTEALESVKNSHKSAIYSSIDILNDEIESLSDEKNQLSTLIETGYKQIELSKINFENEKNNVIAEAEIEYSNIKIDLENEKKILVNYEHTLDKNTITAPADGKFEFSENIKVGAVFPEGTELGELINIAENLRANLNISIPSSEINNIYEGQEIRFTINSKNDNRKKIIHGKIYSISVQPKQTDNGNFYLVYANIKGRQDEFIHGLEGTVSIITGKNTYMDIIIKKMFG